MAGAVRGQGQEVLRLPSMSKREVEELLKNSRICRLAFNDRPQPYIIPLDYVYMNGKMYFHFAGYGKKISLFEKDPHVSVEVDRYNDDITEYESVTLMGTLAKVTDMGEKMAASKKLLESIKSRGGRRTSPPGTAMSGWIWILSCRRARWCSGSTSLITSR